VGVLGDVPQAGGDAVASVLRVHEDLLVSAVDETRFSGSEAHVAFAMTVGGGEEKHLLAGDEGAHLRVEIIEHLIPVKGVGSFPVAVPLLQIVLAARAGHGHHFLLCRITQNGWASSLCDGCARPRGATRLVFQQERESSARIHALPFFPVSPSHLARVAIRTWKSGRRPNTSKTGEEVQS